MAITVDVNHDTITHFVIDILSLDHNYYGKPFHFKCSLCSPQISSSFLACILCPTRGASLLDFPFLEIKKTTTPLSKSLNEGENVTHSPDLVTFEKLPVFIHVPTALFSRYRNHGLNCKFLNVSNVSKCLCVICLLPSQHLAIFFHLTGYSILFSDCKCLLFRTALVMKPRVLK